MMFSTVTLAALVLSTAHAFTTVPKVVVSPTTSTTARFSSNSQTDVEALRAAAAKAREEANRLAQELGKSVNSDGEVSTKPKLSAEEVKSMIPTILSETDPNKQINQWNELKDSKSVTAFGSANLRTFPVSLGMLEQRTGLNADSLGFGDGGDVSLDDFKYATLYVAGGSAIAGIASLAFLPPNIGATLCYLFALLPIVFLGIGSTAPAVIANAIAGLRSNGSEGGSSTVSPKDRICYHEAAHFCCGYWCGLPVTGYSVESDGIARVEFGLDPNTSYSNTEVAALAVTALAGLVGEAKQYETAIGAADDLLVLENVFRKSKEYINSAAQQDITRWGALTAALLLQQNKEKYDKVVTAFQKRTSIEECISILES